MTGTSSTRSGARELLAEANFDFSRPLKIPYISDNPLYGSLVPAIAQFIEDVGIEVELNPMDIAALPGRARRETP